MKDKYVIVQMMNRNKLKVVLLRTNIIEGERIFYWAHIKGNKLVSVWHKTSKKQLIKNKVFPFIIEMLESGAGFTKEEIGIKNIA